MDLRIREYETLRTEVAQRINARQQMAGYAAAITGITAVLGGNLGAWRFLVVAVVLTSALLYLRDSNKAIQRIGLHLQEIERDVNDISRILYGRPVLSWETRRQEQREREGRFWRLMGMAGGWHLREPARELPPPRSSNENTSVNTPPSQPQS